MRLYLDLITILLIYAIYYDINFFNIYDCCNFSPIKGIYSMNEYKKMAVRLRKDYTWTTAFSILSSPDLPESKMEELLRVMTKCTSFSLIKYLLKNNLISITKCASLVGITPVQLRRSQFYRSKLINPYVTNQAIEEEYESNFGV